MRTIVEGEGFSLPAELVAMGAEFADHVLDGVTWTLARDPEMGKPSHYAPHIYILKTVTVAGVSELVFYYKFDDEEVTLLGCVFAHEL